MYIPTYRPEYPRPAEAIEEGSVKAAMCSVHRFERKVFDNANRGGTHEIAYICAPMDATTVPLAEGYAVDAATLQR
jgi:hypothetical protein